MDRYSRKPDGAACESLAVGLRDGRFAPSVSSHLPQHRLSTLPLGRWRVEEPEQPTLFEEVA
jgi:hypothetical protein